MCRQLKYGTMVVSMLSVYLIFCLFSCNSHSKTKTEVKNTFYQIRKNLSEDGIDSLRQKLDRETWTYLERLANICNTPNWLEASQLGAEHNLHLVTLLVYEQMQQYQIDTTVEVASEDILYVMVLHGLGLFRGGNVRIKDFVEINKKYAKASVRVPTGDGNAAIVSKYIFNFEDDQWKINLLSTCSLSEKTLQIQFNKSYLEPELFIRQYLKNKPEEIMFWYRKN